MLKHLQTHTDYFAKQEELKCFVPQEALEEYGETLEMFKRLNFDSAYDLLRSLYSHTGRPALEQIEIFLRA